MNGLRHCMTWLAVIVAVLALPAVALASPPPGKGPHTQPGSARGIVQSVAAQAVVVKELDGTTVRIPVSMSTHVFFDGKRATLGDVRPGLVAIASWKANKAAAKLQLFDATATVAVVRSTAKRAVVVTMPAGTNVTIRVTPKTRVFLDGRPAKLYAVKTGFLLVIKGAPPAGKPATELRFLRPG